MTDNKHLFVPAIEEADLAAIVEILGDIRDFLGATPKVTFTIESNGLIIKGATKMDLREGQQVNASVTLKTAAGNPASYEKGSATWVSSDPATVSVTPDTSDELKAVVKGLNGANNTSVIVTFHADGDPDADQVRDVIATLDVVCTQGEAVVAEITTDTPVDTPPTP